MIRTRFAPSPTGYVHIGSLRTALFNYLFTRKNKGVMVLRIEDTDQKRLVEGAVENLISTLKMLGLDYDEGPIAGGQLGPYVQSERTEIYRKYANELIEKGKAYRCFCTEERLEEMRTRQMARKAAPMYDRTCLKLSEEEIKAKIDAGIPFVIRQKIPHDQTVEFTDLIRGKVRFETNTIDDQVLLKSDKFPTYHLAVVVDDHLMQITHVIRGEDWLPSTPKHILLYRDFGWETPQFAHMPLILNADKSKLSKRQNDVSVESYLNKGYSKEALINFVAFLGWHPGEDMESEILDLSELIEKFSIEKVHKSGAVFDLEKLNWFNFQWQKKKHLEKLTEIAKSIEPDYQTELNQKNETVFKFSKPENKIRFIQSRAELLYDMCKNHLPENWIAEKDKLLKALITVEEKILRKPAEVADYIRFYFDPKEAPLELMLNAKMKVDQSIAKTGLENSINSLSDLDNYEDMDAIQQQLIGLVQKLGLKNGQLLWPIRVALSGEEYSPGTFDLIWVLGKTETIARIKKALQTL